MSNMFTNYNNIDPSYVPNNMHTICKKPQSYTKLDPLKLSKPYELYNAKNELEGYFWHHGENIVLDFSIFGEITVEDDAIILSNKGDKPNNTTVGYVGQKAYNISDYKCWQCTAINDNNYHWVEINSFKYNAELPNSVYLDASDYLRDKTIEFKIFDFRCNELYSRSIKGTEPSKFEISRELSERLLPGIYSCSLSVYNNKVKQIIFGSTDCKLLVK